MVQTQGSRYPLNCFVCAIRASVSSDRDTPVVHQRGCNTKKSLKTYGTGIAVPKRGLRIGPEAIE